MIHLNKGNQPHEFVTQEEFQKRYPGLDKLIKDAPRTKDFRRKRKENHISLVPISNKTAIPVDEISQFEIGARILPDEQITKLFEALDEIISKKEAEDAG